MADAPTNRLPPLGWPWDQMADAVLRWDDANRRYHAAQVALSMVNATTPEGVPIHHDPEQARRDAINARERAMLEREMALGDRFAIREEVVRQWLLGFRLALEVAPTEVAELLGALPPAPAVVAAIQELEDRVDAAEDAVVELEHGRVCR